MSIHRDELIDYLHTYLRVADYKDYGPNGLQVEGRDTIKKIVTGVSASVDLFEKAINQKADAIIVHHGIIWNFERPLYKGGYKKRVKLLLEHNISLLAFHLPLDAHEEVGNNALIARLLGLKNVEPFGEHNGQKVGMRGEWIGAPVRQLMGIVRTHINERALIYDYGPEAIKQVGIISGGAQKEVKQAVLQGLDCYITGEVSEHTLHYVKEEGIHFIAAGHHATERFGIRALGEHIQQQFDVEVEYIEIPNPV